MKILNLRFKNLNSLSGEWSIDFMTPEYVSDGIFAITGSTGAGKSTILDAICLALYGRTPRLKSINKSSNEIMSRQTGECFSEVTFETEAGQFRCHWSQHKARKKADGNLVDSKHEISDAVSGQILESKKRDVANAIESRTGMDFDRFTRSMLLAQGGFAAFLQATPDERAPILEQITGTEIYSEISKRVHERHRKEHGKLELLQAKTGGIVILSDEDETALNQELFCKHKIEKELGPENDALGKSILWLTEIDALKSELSAINKESEFLSNVLKAFKTDRTRLQQAIKAVELDSEFATLSSKRQQQELDLETLAKSKTQLPGQEKMLGLKETVLKKAEETIIRVKDEQKIGLELIKKARALDLRISEKQSALKMAESDCKKIKTQLLKNKKRRQKVESNKETAGKKLFRIEDYLSANAHDATLITELTGINEQIKNFQAAATNVSAINTLILKLKKQFKTDATRHLKQEALCAALKEKHDIAKKQESQIKGSISELLGDRMLREYRAEHNSLLREMACLRKIASLEDERAKLEDDKPCPLCGSLHHPFAEGNVPKIDETEKKINELSGLIQKAEHLKNKLQKDESKEKKAGVALIEAEKELAQTQYKQKDTRTSILRSEKELQLTTGKYAELKNKVVSKLKPFAVKDISDKNLNSISEALAVRQKNWQNYQKQKTEIEKQTSDLASEIKTLDAIMQTLDETLKEKQGVLDAHKKGLNNLTTERNGLYDQKNPDTEEVRLEGFVDEAEKYEKAVRADRNHVREKLNDLKTRITALKESTNRGKPKLDALEASFKISCQKAGFEDEPTFIFCRLSIDERNKLSQRAKKLDDKQADITTRKKDRETRLSQKIDQKTTETSLDDLKKEQGAILESLKKLGEEIGAIKQKLTDNTGAKVKYQQKQMLIEAQKKECTRWDALHSLIGSADGKKYRNFAQGLTFELMVSHANRQLEKMTDRYLLIRDDDQPLELNVVDNYQAGEIRSTKNLSGGESFIVSLSLALGLSKMASRKVRVDSLFLDEGFGSLDEDALETALETLAGLQQDGKLIGIISHVPALKERISTRITVQPVSGGKSVISGPGCVKAP
ncbi:MAG: AAA family ATPase [Deltaproteobacteria bacterium]|nr:AAA family ATPase [Deltaproteobacteria bacterium]MBW2663176.1 AAA family ATPase [Deltaproteobacteria bacterium]